jgi:hypothetical protein
VVGVFLATLAIAVSAIDIQLEGPIGERTYSPLLAADVHRNYEMSIGDLTVDLTNTVLDSDTEIDANVGIGSVTVVVRPMRWCPSMRRRPPAR